MDNFDLEHFEEDLLSDLEVSGIPEKFSAISSDDDLVRMWKRKYEDSMKQISELEQLLTKCRDIMERQKAKIIELREAASANYDSLFNSSISDVAFAPQKKSYSSSSTPSKRVIDDVYDEAEIKSPTVREWNDWFKNVPADLKKNQVKFIGGVPNSFEAVNSQLKEIAVEKCNSKGSNKDPAVAVKGYKMGVVKEVLTSYIEGLTEDLPHNIAKDLKGKNGVLKLKDGTVASSFHFLLYLYHGVRIKITVNTSPGSSAHMAINVDDQENSRIAENIRTSVDVLKREVQVLPSTLKVKTVPDVSALNRWEDNYVKETVFRDAVLKAVQACEKADYTKESFVNELEGVVKTMVSGTEKDSRHRLATVLGMIEGGSSHYCYLLTPAELKSVFVYREQLKFKLSEYWYKIDFKGHFNAFLVTVYKALVSMTALAFVAGSLNTKLKIVAALRCLIISNSDAVFAKVNSSIARNNTPTLSQQAKLEASAALDATEEKQNFSLMFDFLYKSDHCVSSKEFKTLKGWEGFFSSLFVLLLQIYGNFEDKEFSSSAALEAVYDDYDFGKTINKSDKSGVKLMVAIIVSLLLEEDSTPSYVSCTRDKYAQTARLLSVKVGLLIGRRSLLKPKKFYEGLLPIANESVNVDVCNDVVADYLLPTVPHDTGSRGQVALLTSITSDLLDDDIAPPPCPQVDGNSIASQRQSTVVLDPKRIELTVASRAPHTSPPRIPSKQKNSSLPGNTNSNASPPESLSDESVVDTVTGTVDDGEYMLVKGVDASLLPKPNLEILAAFLEEDDYVYGKFPPCEDVWFPGTIRKKNDDFTYFVHFDDHTERTDVALDEITVMDLMIETEGYTVQTLRDKFNSIRPESSKEMKKNSSRKYVVSCIENLLYASGAVSAEKRSDIVKARRVSKRTPKQRYTEV